MQNVKSMICLLIARMLLRLDAWRRPFRYAVRVLVFSAIWVIVGMIFIFGGMLLFSTTMRTGPAGMVGAVILFAIGYVTVFMGVLTAIFRYLPEAIAEKMKG